MMDKICAVNPSSLAELRAMSEASAQNAEDRFLDPLKDKETIEKLIADHLQERLPEIPRDQILGAVEGVSQRLLKVSNVRRPTLPLTEHDGLEEIRAHYKKNP
tara:strand:- start:2184 stop:2492 length:309 start_codon:yes stop_codon:yes gene_type:complete